MIASNGLLESNQRHRVGNKRLAIGKIDADGIKIETRQIMEPQMRNGREQSINLLEMSITIGICINCSTNVVKQLNKKALVNLASTQHIPRFSRHAATIFSHPLQIMWIVSANLKPARIPRPKALALRAKHLITPLGFVNKNLAIRTRFCVGLQKSNGSDSVRIANMCLIIPGSL